MKLSKKLTAEEHQELARKLALIERESYELLVKIQITYGVSGRLVQLAERLVHKSRVGVIRNYLDDAWHDEGYGEMPSPYDEASSKSENSQ
jgi:hypothetical protein